MTMDSIFNIEKNEGKAFLIQTAQTALWKCDFWWKDFNQLINRHCYQEEFYLMNEKPTKDSVDVCLTRFLKKLKSKYKITCHHETQTHIITLSLGFTKTTSCSRGIRHYVRDEIRIEITRQDIHLHLLPYSGFEKVFPLLDYKIIQNILEDFCREFFEHPNEHYIEYQDFCKRLQNSVDKLTYKTREIARCSIESIYEASAEKQKVLNHGYLNFCVMIDGEYDFILYQDFLDDPQVLIKKLQKK